MSFVLHYATACLGDSPWRGWGNDLVLGTLKSDFLSPIAVTAMMLVQTQFLVSIQRH